MARAPNYSFERRERERLKGLKAAEKAEAKRAERARQRGEGEPSAEGATEPADPE
jgi:hypothetical protein